LEGVRREAGAREGRGQLAGEVVVGHVQRLELLLLGRRHPGEGLRDGPLQAVAAQVEALESSERGEECREAAGETVGAEVKDAEAVAGGVGPGGRRDGPSESVAVETELGDAVAEVPYGGWQGPREAVAGEVERGERGRVAELERDGAGQGVGGEVDGVERGEGAEVRWEAAGERGGGEADGDEEEGRVGGERQVGARGGGRGGGGVAAEGPAVGRGPAEPPPEAERRGGVPGGELRVGPLPLQRRLDLGEEQRHVGVGGGRGQRHRGGQAEEEEG